ncbi:MAG: putative transcriptional regulator, TetR family [Frankiales bacterium]|nr:putative transcriptional regulator, TetR family [Frankiales bacterium]
MSDGGRVYGGRSVHERRADRRSRLVSAGLELFGTEGWSGATIERLCTEAGVATRSFYEEFSSREALLRTVYEEILTGVMAFVMPKVIETRGTTADRVRAGLASYVGHLTEDPRRARIVHREVHVAGVLDQERHAMIRRFADIIATETQLPGGAEGHVLALALAGAVTEVLDDWVAQPEPRPTIGPIVNTLVDLYVAAITTVQA